MMMMMNSNVIVLQSNVVKLQHNYINNRNNANTITSYSSNLLPPKMMTLVQNKSAVFGNDIIPDNVFNNADGDDDAFTAELDVSDMYAFTSRKVLPEYLPVTVFTSGFGSKHKLALGNESGMDHILGNYMSDIVGKDMVAMNFNHLVSLGAQPTLFLTPRECPKELREAMRREGRLCASRCGFSIQFSDIEMESGQITSSIGYGSIEGPIIDGKNIEVGDVLIGLESNGGVHSHGFSLVKRVLEQSGRSLKNNLPDDICEIFTLGELIMKPTPVYVKQVLDIISKGGVKGIAYITSGGFTKNIPRLLRSGLGAVILNGSWPVPPILEWIQEVGRIEDAEMRRTFHMGIGMVLVLNKENAFTILDESCCNKVFGSKAYRIGEVVRGDGLTYVTI